jgi:hypothetical protein
MIKIHSSRDVDPDVALPDDIRNTIARGEAVAKSRGLQSRPGCDAPNAGSYDFIMSIVDEELQDRRDSILHARAQAAKGKRQQPPKVERFRFVLIVVEWLESIGIPFGVAPDSKMNKALRKWLNDKAKCSRDPRISRRPPITPDAVRELLKQVRAFRAL